MENKMSVSLIIPCYNEETNLQKGALDKIGNFTKNDERFTEILIVDDGSSDSSKKNIKEKYLNTFPKFKLIENHHQGKAFAVITGIQKAKGDYVLFSDFDLATPIEESEKLIEKLKKNYQIVIGSRTKEREGAPFARKLLALGFIVIRNMLINLEGIRDTQCGFKLFEREAALKILTQLKVFCPIEKTKNDPSVSAGFDLEFLFLANKLGYKIKEVPVVWRHVETKNVKFIHDTLETLKDMLLIKYFYIKGKYNV